MMGRLGHRGPDGNGYFRDRRAALGHTRLAIIDKSGGTQPLCNEDGTVWVTFNGEINGQWAIALWDRRAERLVVFPRPARGTPAVLHPKAGRPAVRVRGEVHFRRPIGRARFRPRRSRPDLHLLVACRTSNGLPRHRATRARFLDRDVVDFANALPVRYKLFGLEEKYLLKRAFADLVPDDILHRPKQPYQAPNAASFFTPDRPAWFEAFMAERATAAAGVFEPPLVAGLLAKCERTGGENMSNTDNMRVLAIVSTQLTHEYFIAGGGRGALEWSLPDPSVAVDLVADHRSVP